jgi:hypothetical protein
MDRLAGLGCQSGASAVSLGSRNRRHSYVVVIASQGTTTMADDKSKQDGRDRSRVAAGEDYEVQYLVEQSGLTPEQARTLIRRYGNDRQKLMEEAKNFRG